MTFSNLLSNIIKYLTGFLGLFLLVYLLTFFARESGKVYTWRNSGGANSDVRMLKDSVLVFAAVDSADFLQKPYPVKGDTIVSVQDSSEHLPILWDEHFDSPLTIGLEFKIGYLRRGEVVHNILKTSTPKQTEFWLIVILQILRFAIALLFAGVGLWAFFKRPDSGAVRSLALFSFVMTSFMITGVTALSTRFVVFEIPLLEQIREVLNNISLLAGAFWLNLAMLFPRPVKLMKERPFWAYALIYTPYIIFPLCMLLFGDWFKSNTGAVFIGTTLSVQIGAGFWILAYRRKRLEDKLEQRQIKLVLLGTGIGLGMLFALFISIGLFKEWFADKQYYIIFAVLLSFTGLLLCPISFAYAFGKYRLLEVEAKLKRGTRYFFAVLATVILFATVITGTALLLKKYTGGEINLQFFYLLVVIGAIVVNRFGTKRIGIRSYFERRFYPERAKLRQMLSEFLSTAFSIPDKETFWEQLNRRLCDGLAIEKVYPILRDKQHIGHFGNHHEPTPFQDSSELMQMFARERKPLLVDEMIASGRTKVTEGEQKWLKDKQPALIVPLTFRDQLAGFLALGPKKEGEDYSAEELQILQSLSLQIALASENMNLLEDNLVKQRLEEEMKVARKIQMGMLPQGIPQTRGLEIATRSKFCLEVAGDYYDIISLQDGSTILAVGDVAGKGTGAALIMANLQAALRTAVGFGVKLSDIVARINELIYHNTTPEQYITFFVGIYESKTRQFSYVNAGHNHPILLKRDGSIVAFDIGGVILGSLGGMPYEQETLTLEQGNLLLLFTDGVSEAMNEKDEEFSEAKIREAMIKYQALSPKELLEKIEEEVILFHGEDHFEDDFTLLLAKVI